MPNHFHVVVETPQPNLVTGMKWLLGTYTSRFNRRHKLFGHLFSGRYKSLIVDGSGSGYLKSVGDYVHLNPARAKRPAWLRVDRLLGAWGIPEDSPAGRQRLEQALEERRRAEEGEEFKPIRRGWCLGEEKFREELLKQMSARMGSETTMTVGWIAERLAMGTRGYLNHLLYRRRKLGGEYPISRTDPFLTPF
jgi:putative transposase